VVRYPAKIHLREVSPRDGLQAEPAILATEDKVRLIDMLSEAGFPQINAVSFVSPKAVPQMADAAEVAARIIRQPGVLYDASVPNQRGLQRAIDAGFAAVLIFVSASDAGSRSNVGRSTDDALTEAEAVIAAARAAGLQITGLVAKAFGSAYEGVTPLETVLAMLQRLAAAGATSLALGDTSGEATPRQVERWVATILDRFPQLPLALHFHDTRGLALANTLAAMDAGATHFDAAVGGIGGSPFTRNSAGNLATEDLLHMCEEAGVATGVELDRVLEVYRFLEAKLGHPLPGRVGRFGRSKTAAAAM
jgi:hydroxymethylglutaryl-CoA lyase